MYLYLLPRKLTLLLCLTLLSFTSLLAQGDCDEESDLNTATRWSGYIDGGDEDRLIVMDVADATAACDSALSFNVTAAQEDWWQAGFNYGHEQNVVAQVGRRYRMSMRYRSTEERDIYWRIIDRPRDTFGGAADSAVVATTLTATTEYQDYTVEFTAVDTATVDHIFFFLGMMGDNVEPVFIDNFSITEIDPDEEEPGTCQEGPFNDLSIYSAYNTQGQQQTVAEVEDAEAVCGNAISATLPTVQETPFQAGLQINVGNAPRFNADAEYRLRFRYRSDTDRTIYYRAITRPTDNGDGGREVVAADLSTTPEYQQFDTVISSAEGGQDSLLYQLWMNGDNVSPIYIDDFSFVQVGGVCRNEDAVYNDTTSYTTYGGATVTEVEDANAVCNDALLITNPTARDEPFAAGFEITQPAALADVAEIDYEIAFSYRADEARTVPILLTSRKRGTFGTNDGPVYAFAELAMTTEYQRYNATFTSTISSDSTDRIIQFLLAVGSGTSDVYLDDIVMRAIEPAREETFTFYVHPDGSDDNDGLSLSAEGAFKTMRYALAQLVPGDSLLVADGIYAENNLRVRDVRGDSSRVTVVKSINPWGAKIEGNIKFNVNLKVENSTHIKVEGFEIYSTGRTPETNSATGLEIMGSDYVILENNYVHDCGCGGLSGRESDYMTIQRNVARDNARYSEFNCSGISIFQPRMLDEKPGTHILIRDNVSFENEVRRAFSPLGFNVPTDGNGIILDDYDNTQSFNDQPNETPPYVAETVVENNLVFSNGGAGIKAFQVENAIIRNNTSYHNNFVLQEFTTNSGEIILQAFGGVAEVYNNLMVSEFDFVGQAFSSQTDGDAEVILANNLAVGNVVFSGADPELTENTFVTADRQSFPQFAQARDSVFFQTFEFSSVDDFKQFFGLREESPAINAGDNNLGTDKDLNGVDRPIDDRTDIGAYEGAVEGVGELPGDERLVAFAVSTPTPLQVDGIKEGLYTGAENQITKLIDGAVDDRNDLSGSWTAAYTDQALYLLLEIRDDSLVSTSEANQMTDAVELYFDGNNAAGDTSDTDDRSFLITYGDEATLTNLTTGEEDGSEAIFLDTDGGYVLEIAIPWSLIGVTPVDSLRIGFDVQVDDVDLGDDNQGGKLAWSASIDSAGVQPSLLGELALREVPAPPVIMGVRDSIAIDGMADEAYARAEIYEMLNPVQPGITGEADFSGNWRSVYDTTGIYFLVEIADDTLINDSDNWYEDDGVEIYLDARNDKASTYDGDDHQIVIEYDGEAIYDTKGTLGTGATSAIAVNDSGYVVEAYIPWSALGIEPSVGYFLGFDVHGIDDDAGAGGNDGKLAWFTTLDESFNNPSLFGTIILGDLDGTSIVSRPLPGDWLSVSPNPASDLLQYRFETTREGTLWLHDLQGRLMFERRISGLGGTVSVADLPTGMYLMTVRDGKEWARLKVMVGR